MLKNLKWIAGSATHLTQSSPTHAGSTGSDPILNGGGHSGAHHGDGKGNGLAPTEDGGPDAKQFGMENVSC